MGRKPAGRIGGASHASRSWPTRATVVAGFLAPLILLSACGPRVILVERGPQAYYQTAFPTHDTSRDLERAFQSLRRVVFTGEYRTYFFAPEAAVTVADLQDPAVLGRATEQLVETHSKAGTAVLVARTDRLGAYVTNNHVVRFAPARVRYFEEDVTRRPRAERRVASYSVLTHEWGGLAEHPGLGMLTVLARDSAQDIAIFEIPLPRGEAADRFRPMSAPPGDARRLSLGSFVYVLGYPSGYPMVTRAIVSDPNRDRRGGFLTDGLWNEGISGGPILAVRGETGTLEWVGITRAGAGAREIRLQPGEMEAPDEDFGILYDGPVYAEATLRIQYGIALSVSMTALRRFVDIHRAALDRRGYDMRRF